ncbi:OPT-domain-containing protein [Metschnikowia bicuspidata var. bicuspidata NRRL YB-4993]|uniref:OPT-domain-containing protein n=1 Tax=Metschnikowia bicuspidata var. bicuspidata NRRL YB-4993 TaxID=869754 RepID=A0A1A0HAK6_9ASCO|nr:OPT-domain-containing protein [Metschnikowia bicuspidata var. bicuspidata NRRL YB-4993]OBA21035.1 OPT-domain-containing protein [Metschnikowia bicuspidata var. bicuspidata NRRL YB-4993]
MTPANEYIELDDLGTARGISKISGDSFIAGLDPVNEKKWHSYTQHQLAVLLPKLGVLEFQIPLDFDMFLPLVKYMMAKVDMLDLLEAINILRDALVEHSGDVNFPTEDFKLIEELLATMPAETEGLKALNEGVGAFSKGYSDDPKMAETPPENSTFWAARVKLEAALIAFHSPYPEVRAVVDPYDDPLLPVETLRVYVISLFWTLVGSIINNFFVHRMPGITLSTSTVQLLLLPSGRLWERVFPLDMTVSVFGRRFNMNPGRWNSKEMMLASIIYSCSAGTPYAVYNIFVMKLDRFYGLKWVNWVYQVCFTLSTQFLGFAFAFMMLRVCVYPKKAVWPTILPVIALNRALMESERPEVINGWRISRYAFFFVVFVASFCYNWLPSLFFTTLSTFNWPTWFRPNLVHLNNISGTNSGLGLNPWPTFDWNILDMAGCLTIPFFTYANHFCGMILAFCTILAVYYSNNKWTAYFPINSNRLFNNRGDIYDVHKILNDNSGFDQDKYLKYGPPYFSAANLVLYGAYFFLYPFAILYHTVTEWSSMSQSFISIWHTVKGAFLSGHDEQLQRFSHDPHCKMMSKYEEVPTLWFLVILALSVILAVSCVWFYPVETPVWGIFFAIALNFVFLIPITSISSVTGFTFGLNVLVELIVGYAIPNSGLALITLKAYGYNIDSQASNYITDQKLAHYTKIPPRSIFRGQIISTFLTVFVSLFIANWQIGNIPDICAADQKNKLKCPGANTFFFASIQYGEIGPAKVFGGIYPILKWCFLFGALLVFPLAYLKKKGPSDFMKYFQPTVIVGGFLAYGPYNLLYYTGGLYMSFTFMYYIKKNYTLWWEKYNYILTSALSSGVAFSALVIFFVQFRGVEFKWWGNNLSSIGIEGHKIKPSWLHAKDAPEGYVGLREGSFP